MPIYLSWDIGIVNLAYNLIEVKDDISLKCPEDIQDPKNIKILDWGIINLSETTKSIPKEANIIIIMIVIIVMMTVIIMTKSMK